MATTFIRSLNDIKPHQQGAVVTIGNFDGVHIGHEHLIAQTIESAKSLNAPSLLITFEPHPFEFFNQNSQKGLARLTRFREKMIALGALGIEHILILPFNANLAQLSPKDFVNLIIVKALKAKAIWIGDDFRFGKKREGDIPLLTSLGNANHFSVNALSPVLLDGIRVSSTRVRQALADGDHTLAHRLLGRPYSMLGRIVRGDQLGRQWGFPTANIKLHRSVTPVHGIYTVFVEGLMANPLPGVANVGSRPTVDGTRTLLEVHLLDFDQDIYGREVSVVFCEKMRDEVRYANIALLKQQIAKDVLLARDYFHKQGVL